MNREAEQELGKLSFPCRIGIKAMGRQSGDFPRTVRALVALHVDDEAISEVRVRTSAGGRFLSVTVEVALQERSQMEAIYAAMHEHPDILMTL